MAGVFETIKNAFRIQDLRRKLLYTLGLLAIYRIGTQIPVPGINREIFTQLFERFGNLGNMFDLVSGGALYSASIFTMGIQPYINASIIMQLMTVVIPALERLQKEGDEGRKKIMQIVRYVTIGLGLIQAVALWYGARDAMQSSLPAWLNAILVIATFTAGTAFIMWLGEQINEYGIGNGISLIIFAGIVTRGPSAVQTLWLYFQSWTEGGSFFLSLGMTILVVAVFLVVIGLVVFVQQAERRIPIQYAKKVVGRKLYGGQSTYLPLKVNMAGVIPIIFAMSIMMLPQTLIGFFFSGSDSPIVQWILNASQGSVGYYTLYALLIFGFTFFYTMIQFNPVEISNNLQKNGGFIPGIRPGRPTADFIKHSANRISWFDGIFLALVTLLPVILGSITRAPGLWFGGTAVLILVGVALDLVNQMESQMLMRHYKGFLD